MERTGSTYVQIGAGAGDLDPAVEFRDGFTKFVKSLEPRTIKKIILVEPNPKNIPTLKQCWKDYPQAEIFQVGIRTKEFSQEQLEFYWAEEDAPHFQIFSVRESHVRKHYPHATLRTTSVPTITMLELLNKIEAPIDLLSIDIEGLDAELLMETDWNSIRCNRVSFEFIHLGDHSLKVHQRLKEAGFISTGVGMDEFSLMYERPTSLRVFLCYTKCFLGGWWRVKGLPVRWRIQSFLKRFKAI